MNIEATEVTVSPNCRIDGGVGFWVLDAAANRVKAGGCPWKGRKFRTDIQAKPNTKEAEAEIAKKLACSVCQAVAKVGNGAGFWYTETRGHDAELEFIE